MSFLFSTRISSISFRGDYKTRHVLPSYLPSLLLALTLPLLHSCFFTPLPPLQRVGVNVRAPTCVSKRETVERKEAPIFLISQASLCCTTVPRERALVSAASCLTKDPSVFPLCVSSAATPPPSPTPLWYIPSLSPGAFLTDLGRLRSPSVSVRVELSLYSSVEA
ncbi:hypothetical protein JOQ06_015427 [Pogonophryne albipinna]|uniref:Uncharacterized protein n=1 Tax=Pogonophryne albipinna TaxID=1090488 RepID=A0AAD6ALD2_9TELE|nr:hypothetical protein JOQ06_015427 [Pogonophryne albipinna]